MSLSKRTKDIMIVSMADRKAALELASAVDTGANPQAASVAAFGATANMSALVVSACSFVASNATLSTGDTYSDAAVKASIDGAIDVATAAAKAILDIKADNADVETLRTEAEARLDAIEAKINAVIAALKAAALMA